MKTFRYLVLVCCLFYAVPLHAQVTLPYFQDFEGASGTIQADTPSITDIPEFGFSSTDPEGRLRFEAFPGSAVSGTRAATLDRSNSVGGNTTNFLTLTLDMSNYDASVTPIVLSFQHAHHGDESNANDRVWIRGSDSDTFIEAVDLTGTPSGTFELFRAALSDLLLANNQNYSATFQVLSLIHISEPTRPY